MALNSTHELYASPEQREKFRQEVEVHNYVRNFEVTLRKKSGALLTAMESSFATRTRAEKSNAIRVSPGHHREEEGGRRNPTA